MKMTQKYFAAFLTNFWHNHDFISISTLNEIPLRLRIPVGNKIHFVPLLQLLICLHRSHNIEQKASLVTSFKKFKYIYFTADIYEAVYYHKIHDFS